ncbi:MAG: hypothetical protein WBP73_03665 [Terriglobales bacterium]
MKNEPRLLLFVSLFLLLYPISKAQAQSGPLDVTIPSCATFAADESHLDAAFHVVTKGYKTIPGQAKPVAEIEGVETPEKVKEFMDWYPNGGRIEMKAAGSMCEIETMNKAGETAQLRTGTYIAEERARTAEFFADKLLKQCTGKP